VRRREAELLFQRMIFFCQGLNARHDCVFGRDQILDLPVGDGSETRREAVRALVPESYMSKESVFLFLE
jgi:hypothetical protein